MKKTLCFLLLVALALASVPLAAAEADPTPSQPSSWAAETVEEAISLDIIPVWLRLKVNWQKDLTRGEFAKLVVRFLAVQYGYCGDASPWMSDCWEEDLLNLHARPDGQPFVKADYYPELERSPDQSIKWSQILAGHVHAFDDVDGFIDINLAYLLGIVKGRGDGTYDPDGIITRQEAAALLARTYQVYAQLDPPPTAAEPFSDSDEIDPWAQESVAAMQGWGILLGDENGALDPHGHYTWEQGVATLMRLYHNMPVSRYNDTLTSLLPYADLVERLRDRNSNQVALVQYEAETEICTILYVTYGGVMHPPAPAIFLIYPNSTFKRIELDGWVEDGFQLNENNTKLLFSDGTSRILDLRAGILLSDSTHSAKTSQIRGTHHVLPPSFYNGRSTRASKFL